LLSAVRPERMRETMDYENNNHLNNGNESEDRSENTENGSRTEDNYNAGNETAGTANAGSETAGTVNAESGTATDTNAGSETSASANTESGIPGNTGGSPEYSWNTNSGYGNSENANSGYGNSQNANSGYGGSQNANSSYGTSGNANGNYGYSWNANSGYGSSRNANGNYGSAQNANSGYGSSQNVNGGYRSFQNANGGYRASGNMNGGYGSFQNSGSGYGSGGNNRNKKPKKKSTWPKLIATALVFGLIAGATAFATNYTARAVSQSGNEDSESSAVTTSASSSGDSGSGSSTKGDTSVEKVASTAMPSLVTISTMSVEEMQNFFGQSQQYEVSGAGTGVIVGENDDEYLIATNYHVIEGAQTVSIGFIDESVVSANVKGTDADNDLAVLAVNKSDVEDDTKTQIKIIEMGDSDELKLGDRVVAIGNALGYGQSVTSGYVSALNRDLTTSDGSTSEGLIQTDAAINPGNSGGALLNMDGELVGINEGKSTSTSDGVTVDNMGYAIPISKAQPILENLMTQETKTVVDEEDRGYLGARVANVTSEYSQVYNMPEGVCLISVDEGGAADSAGLQKGDIITAFAGQSVSTYSEMKNVMQYYKAGDKVEITYERSDNGEYKEAKVTVTLESKSDAEAASENQNSSSSSQGNGSADSGNGSGASSIQ
jgi:serine protease Do